MIGVCEQANDTISAAVKATLILDVYKRQEARWEEKHIVDGFEFPVTHTASVTIGAHVWIGGGTIILPGVSIGDGCVVGAGSLVTRDIPAGSVAYGSPCRVVRENM